MNRQLCLAAVNLAALAALVAPQCATAQHAVQVVSYDPGTTPSIDFESGKPYNLRAAAIGEPSRYINDPFFAGVVSPFNSPYKRVQLISVGEAGQLTLRLSNFALPQGGNEIGVFTHVGILDLDFPNGLAGAPPIAFGVDSALVEMSADGVTWVAVSPDATEFDIPTNGYADASGPFSMLQGSTPSDFRQPFVGSLNDFGGLPYTDDTDSDMLGLLNGSGGGKWLDIPASLAQVGYVRFTVADDGDLNSFVNFELDAISIAHGALGAPTVPEPVATAMIALAVAAGLMRRSRGCG